MKLGVYLFPTIMLAYLGWIVVRETREAIRWHKLAQRISQIGKPPIHHQLTETDFRERRR